MILLTVEQSCVQWEKPDEPILALYSIVISLNRILVCVLALVLGSALRPLPSLTVAGIYVYEWTRLEPYLTRTVSAYQANDVAFRGMLSGTPHEGLTVVRNFECT